MIGLGAGAAVRLVGELYATGNYSHRSLADELNRRGVATATGFGKWWPKTVSAAIAAAEEIGPEPPKTDPVPELADAALVAKVRELFDIDISFDGADEKTR
jgi:hypothetical protein